MNVVILSGNVGGDPEVVQTPSGAEVANFSLAVERYRGKDAEPETMWIRCALWGAAVKVAPYFGRGDRLTVQGRLRLTKKGDREYVSVDVEEVVLPPRRREAGNEAGNKAAGKTRGGSRKNKEADDDLPW